MEIRSMDVKTILAYVHIRLPSFMGGS